MVYTTQTDIQPIHDMISSTDFIVSITQEKDGEYTLKKKQG